MKRSLTSQDQVTEFKSDPRATMSEAANRSSIYFDFKLHAALRLKAVHGQPQCVGYRRGIYR